MKYVLLSAILFSCTESKTELGPQPPIFQTSEMIQPREPISSDVVFCLPNAIDANGDVLEYSFVWTDEAGTVLSEESSLDVHNSGLSPLSSVSCTATVSNNLGEEASNTDTVVIKNQEPQIEEVLITPSEDLTVRSLLMCSNIGIDPDGFSVESVYSWQIDGVEVGTESTVQLSPNFAYDGARVSCQATVQDPHGGIAQESASVVLGNDTPRIDSIMFSHESVYGFIPVSCLVDTSDGDGDVVSIRYQWKIDGVIQQQNEPQFDLSALVGGRFSVGSILTCTATPFDDVSVGASKSISTQILNEEPQLSNLAITPSVIYADSTLLCGGQAHDPDNHSVSVGYSWDVDGIEVGTQSSLHLSPSLVSPSNIVSCTMTIQDEAGAVVSDVTAKEVQDTNPVISHLQILPAQVPMTGDSITCVASATDINNDILSFSYEWKDSLGTVVSTEATLVLDAQNSEPGEELLCSVLVTPASETVSESTSIMMGNIAPIFDSVSLSPETGIRSDSFMCSTLGASDLDEQTLVDDFRWYINNIPQNKTGNSFSSTDLQVGDVLRCSARVFDGLAYSSWQSVETIIQNQDPTIDSVTIFPSGVVVADDVLTCSYTASDEDGDVLTATYTWYDNNNIEVSTSSILALNPETNNPDDVFRCSVTVTDENGGQHSQTESIIISNTPPYFSQPAVLDSGETTVYMGDVLNCSAVAMDLDDGILDIEYRWEDLDGNLLHIGSSFDITAENIGERDALSCVAFAEDSYGSSLGSSVDIEIANSLPIIESIAIMPSEPISTDALLCSVASVTDADEDTVNVSYRWYIDSVLQNTSSDTLNGPFMVGAEVTCRVTPADSAGFGTPIESTVVIQNSLPIISDLRISPTDVNVNSAVTCLSSVSDIDDETLLISLAWTKEDGTVLSTDSQFQLSRSIIGTEHLTCTVTATDESGATTVESTSVQLENTAPTWTAEAFIVKPNGVLANQTIRCFAEANDVDDGSLDISYTWTNAFGTVLSTDAALLLNPSQLDVDDMLTCTAVAMDSGSLAITSIATEILINSAPVVMVEIPDATYKAGSTIPCTATGSDEDEETVSFRYEWSINGAVQSETSSSFTGSFKRADEVTCTVIPNDGHGDGAAISSTVEITNTAPSIASMGFLSSSLQTNDTAVFSATPTDVDGDNVSMTYKWYVDDILVKSGTGTSLSGSTYFDKDQDVHVVVELTDSFDAGTPTKSSTLTILNTGPVAPIVGISPGAAGILLQDLNCIIDIDAEDDDGDVLSYQYFWYQESNYFISTLSNVQPERVPAEELNIAGLWKCYVTVTDDDGVSATSNTASIYVQEQGESAEAAGVSCLDIMQSTVFGNRAAYWIDPSGSSPYQTACDFTADGGGWTLAFSAPASDTTYGSAWPYWYQEGATVDLVPGASGKGGAYDDLPFTEIRLTATDGSSEIRADAGSQGSLVDLVGSVPTVCTDLIAAGRSHFNSTFRTGTYFVNDYIAVVACDNDGTALEVDTHYDMAVFTTNLNHADYDMAKGDIGSEFRVGGINGDSSSSSGNILQIWVR